MAVMRGRLAEVWNVDNAIRGEVARKLPSDFQDLASISVTRAFLCSAIACIVNAPQQPCCNWQLHQEGDIGCAHQQAAQRVLIRTDNANGDNDPAVVMCCQLLDLEARLV
jgi:hypothetical protein